MKKRFLFIIFSAVFCISLALSAFAASLSPAFDVMTKNLRLEKNVIYEDKISFEISDFSSVLGTESYNSIKITSLPSLSDGILKLGGVDVTENQVISKTAIPYLYFVVANNDVKYASFSFVPDIFDSKNTVSCDMNIIENLAANMEKEISRIDFLIHAMNKAGLNKNLEYVLDSGFFDDSEMTGYQKSYAHFAREMGIISGKTVDEKVYFCPDEIITVGEAAHILNNIMDYDAPVLVYIPDSSPLFPAEYRNSLLALYYADIITADTLACAKNPLTAKIAMQLLEE